MTITNRPVVIYPTGPNSFGAIRGTILEEDDIAITVSAPRQGVAVTSVIPWTSVGRIEILGAAA